MTNAHSLFHKSLTVNRDQDDRSDRTKSSWRRAPVSAWENSIYGPMELSRAAKVQENTGRASVIIWS